MTISHVHCGSSSAYRCKPTACSISDSWIQQASKIDRGAELGSAQNMGVTLFEQAYGKYLSPLDMNLLISTLRNVHTTNAEAGPKTIVARDGGGITLHNFGNYCNRYKL